MNNIDPDQRLCLAIDQGGHASRAALINALGGTIQSAVIPIRARHEENRVEYTARDLLASISEAVDATCEGIDPARIACAGLATQRSNIACWRHDSGEPLSPVISWQDRRAAQWMEQYSNHRTMIHDITGLFPSPYYGISKLKWCLNSLPAVSEVHASEQLVCGPMATLIRRHLTCADNDLADPVNASRTLLYDYRHNHWWSTPLTRLFDFPVRVLPPCGKNRDDFGFLDNGPIPLSIVTGDQSAALFATGALRDDTAYVTLGTGAFILRSTGNTPVSHPQLLGSLLHSEDSGNIYALEGTVNGAGSAVDYFAQKWQLYDHEQQLNDWLDDFNAPPLFINTFSGLGTPWLRSDIDWQFIEADRGQPHDDRAYMVAILESILFLLTSNLELMRHTPAPLQQILLGGGLGRADGLCQRLADLSGLPVIRHEETETTRLGLAFLLHGQPANWQRGPTKTFNPADNPALNGRYNQWLKHMEKICHGR